MTSNDQLSDLQYELLFKKTSYQSEWDGKSPERSSVPSFPSEENGLLEQPQDPFNDKSEDPLNVTSSASNFRPSTVQFDSQLICFDVPSPTRSAYTADSLEDLDTKISKTEENEEEAESEEDSEDSLVTETELDNEDCEKEDGNPVDYLDEKVFPVLLPCLETMLFAAKENDVLKGQKSCFNGLDYLAELLWNCNPLHPERRDTYVPLYEIPFVQKHLEENPRPIIPQSWKWTRDQAAIVLQAAIRGYLVRCQPEIQEMRQFWKTLAEEKRLAKQEDQTEENLPEEKHKITAESTMSRIDANASIYSFFNQYLDGKP